MSTSSTKTPSASPSASKSAKKPDLKKLCIIFTVISAILALIIGLSVGLTKRNRSPPPTSSTDAQTSGGTFIGEGVGIGSLLSATMYTSAADDPLPWTLPSFNKDILQGYDTCDVLRQDLTEATNFLVSAIIKRNARYSYSGLDYDKGGDGDIMIETQVLADDSMAAMPESAPAPPGAAADTDRGFAAEESSSESGSTESDWGTNNQVEGVDEADVVKSDGTNIFAAYGDRLVHFDKDGNKRSVTTMPAPDFDMEECEKNYGYGGRRQLHNNNSNNNNKSHPNLRRASSIMSDVMYYQCRAPTARIESLLLLDNGLLVAVVTGYGQQNYWSPYSTNHDERSILGNADNTKVFVYATDMYTPNEEEESEVSWQLKLLGERNLPGQFNQKGGRSIGNNVYLVSSNWVDTYHHLNRHFDRYQIIYDGLSDEEYITTASDYAKTKVIPDFIDRLLTELGEDLDGKSIDGDCSHIQQVSLYQTGDVDAITNNWWSGGVFGGLTQITALDLNAISPEDFIDTPLPATMSVSFVPSSWGTTVYATQDMIFLATEGYDEHPKSQSGFIPSTFILGYSIGGDGVAKSAMVGKVPGRVLSGNSQFSLDYYDGHLRVATTTWSTFVCPVEEEPPLETDLEDESVLEKEPALEDIEIEDAELSREDVLLVDPEPVFCRGERFRGPQNQITVLSVDPSSDVMDQVGYLGGLGKPGESIYAVRFLKERGFVVTFERIDPFYTIDLSVPSEPTVVGELEIPGFSNYIHPTEDPNILIAVGEDADENGRTIGVAITLFDVTDFSKPALIARETLEESKEQWSSSEVQWDHRAFRYLRESQRVILPAQIYGSRGSNDSFDGFYVFRLPDLSSIELKHRIDLAPDDEELFGYCYSPARLSPRSMLFEGKALLMKNHAVESHNLDAAPDETFVWRLEMDNPVSEKENKGDYCYYWW